MNNPTIDEFGTKRWYNKNNQLHRTDGPAMVFPNLAEYWFIDGKLHRTDGPAIVCTNGIKFWFLDGEIKSEKILQ